MDTPSLPPGTSIPATFDGSVFRPNAPVALPPNTEVLLTVEPTRDKPKKPMSFLDTLASIKVEGPPDWSTNLDKYLYGDPPDAQ